MTEKKSINFPVVPQEPDDAESPDSVYANFCAVNHTPFDFTLFVPSAGATRNIWVNRCCLASGPPSQSDAAAFEGGRVQAGQRGIRDG